MFVLYLLKMKRNIMLKKIVLFSILLLTMTQASAQSKTHLVFSPQWHAQAQFAGYIVAQRLGFYEAEGLDVKIKFPTETTSSLDLLNEGKADLITNMLATAIFQKTKNNIDLVNVLQTSQHASLCLVRKPGKTPLDNKMLNGLRVGLWYNGLSLPAEAMNIIEGLNWKTVYFREGFNLLNYDMVDALTAMEYNELLRMKYCGRDVSELSVLHLCDIGYDIPEDGLYCLRSFYKEHKPEVDAFIRASKKGWEWCRQHPDTAIDYVIDQMRSEFIYSSVVIQRASLKVILEKQKNVHGKVTYRLEHSQFDEAVRLLKKAKLIVSTPDFQNFIAR